MVYVRICGTTLFSATLFGFENAIGPFGTAFMFHFLGDGYPKTHGIQWFSYQKAPFLWSEVPEVSGHDLLMSRNRKYQVPV